MSCEIDMADKERVYLLKSWLWEINCILVVFLVCNGSLINSRRVSSLTRDNCAGIQARIGGGG